MKYLALTISIVVLIFASCGEAVEEHVEIETPDENVVVEEETPEVVELTTIDLSLDTIYSGNNVYVRNPFSSTGVGFCVKQVWVNGQSTEMQVDADAFEIDLSTMDVAEGDSVCITVIHETGCKPAFIESLTNE